MDEYEEKWCGNCKHYVKIGGYCPSIEICCKHRVRIMAEDDLYCYEWENDNLHDNDAMDRDVEKGLKTLFGKE